MDIFAKATKQKVRFNTAKGDLTVEDLWDLPLTSEKHVSLDKLAKGIFVALREAEEVSFVSPASTSNSLLELKLEIVKFIIEAKQADNKSKRDAEENRRKKELIGRILEEKRDEELKGKDLKDLEEMYAAL